VSGGGGWSDRAPWRLEALDALIALLLIVVCVIAHLAAEPTAAQPRDGDALGVALVVVACGALAVRRRWPLAVLVVAAAATTAVYIRGYSDSGLPFVVLIALYTVAARCDRRVTVLATAALLGTIVAVVAPASDMDNGSLAGALAVYLLAAGWGDHRKVRDAYAEQLELRAAEKERERVQAAQRAVAEERLRIARELHDVVAHAMSVVAVQSGVGAHVIDSRPEEAKRILETISRTSRDSLDEMRRLLGVLRSGPATTGPAGAIGPTDATGPTDAPEPTDATGSMGATESIEAAVELAPAPGLGSLDELATRVTESGVPVSVEVQGERGALPVGVDLAAYRIVQEALTNVLKHAGPARACVVVRYGPGAVRVEIDDDGRGAGSRASTANGSGTGHGLVGMRERAALYGGDLQAGPRPGGGYRVSATLRYAPS
jgi:signal transduction histidine kinase